MKDEFINRLGMFTAAANTLNEPAHKEIWFGHEPEIFALKVAAATQAVQDLKTFCQKQERSLHGVTLNKEREGEEAVAVAFRISGFLVEYFRDAENETDAEAVNLALSDFRRLRDQQAVGKLREVRDLAKGLVENTDPLIVTTAAQYGITAAALASLHKEVEEYAAAVEAPQTSIGQRAQLSKQMRDRFNAVEAKLASLDRLILAFEGTPEGRAFISNYQAARIVRDAGAGPHTATTPTP